MNVGELTRGRNEDEDIYLYHKMHGKIMPESIMIRATKMQGSSDGVILSGDEVPAGMNIEKTMKEVGLFAAPLNNGSWMVGKANCIYHLNVGSDHYQDERLAIAPTLEEAIQRWVAAQTKPMRNIKENDEH